MEDLEENVSLMLKILTTGGFKPMNLFSNLIFLNNLIFFFYVMKTCMLVPKFIYK